MTTHVSNTWRVSAAVPITTPLLPIMKTGELTVYDEALGSSLACCSSKQEATKEYLSPDMQGLADN